MGLRTPPPPPRKTKTTAKEGLYSGSPGFWPVSDWVVEWAPIWKSGTPWILKKNNSIQNRSEYNF